MTQTREKVFSFGTFRFVPSRKQLFDADRPLRTRKRLRTLPIQAAELKKPT